MNATPLSLRHLSPNDFAVFGLNEVAYVKTDVEDGRTVYAIHAADGTRLAAVRSREEALTTIRRNDLEPMSAH